MKTTAAKNEISVCYGQIVLTRRATTYLLSAHQWVGHHCSAYEGPIQRVRIVRSTITEAIAGLRKRWLAEVGQTRYVGFGGHFRHVPCLERHEVLEMIDAIEEAIDAAGW